MRNEELLESLRGSLEKEGMSLEECVGTLVLEGSLLVVADDEGDIYFVLTPRGHKRADEYEDKLFSKWEEGFDGS